MLCDFFVGGSAPSSSECVGEGDPRLLFRLPVGSLGLTNDPPATTCFSMVKSFVREGKALIAKYRLMGKDNVS